MNIELKDKNGITLKTAGKYCSSDVGIIPKLQSKSVATNGSVVADEGYCGLDSVTVAVPATPTQEKTVDLAMASGDQVIPPDSGYDLSKVTVKKPSTLVASNIKTGVSIGGVTGTLEAKKDEEAKTVDLAMASGNQTITPTSGKVLSQVVVKKPATMLPENIKKNVNIGGVTGTLEPQKQEEAGTATITENGSQTFSPTSGKVFSNFTVTTNVPTGVDTSDATAVASDILSGKTAYAKGVKLTGSVGTYDGTFVIKVGYWKASVSNLGAQDPSTVVFNTPADSVPKPWSEVEFNGDVFIKFPKMYKKIVTVTDNQITAFEIASKKIDNDYKLYPCFIDENGNELDYILVGKYETKSDTTCNSVETGSVVPQTISNGREKAKSRGTGYQIMDWRIQRLWQDLVICVAKKIKINNGDPSGLPIDAIGIHWDGNQWIDGFCCNNATWLYSNTPSKYVNAPTANTESYSEISGYAASAPRGKSIKKFGYDSTQPFFNYPSEAITGSTFTTYYCDAFSRYYTTENNPISTNVGNASAGVGAFRCDGYFGWTSTSPTVRLCYRPISS